MIAPDPIRSAPPPRLRSVVAVTSMLLAAFVTYASPGLLDGRWRLYGLDCVLLHQRRIDFALSQIREHGTLPAWYPREQMGVPFWSNIQSFPFLPTRLALLATGPTNVFTLAVYLSVALSAGFTYLFARKIGAGVVGSAAAGWTFACSGFFASRLLAGQLGMLEGFPALPILLWTTERFRASLPGRSFAGWTALLAAICTSYSLTAHPQLPTYALATTAAYVLWRCRGRRLLVAAAAMVLGVAMAAFALVPMTQLIARSSRVLVLDPPTNDISMPYARLLALLFPWRDGAPSPVTRPEGVGDVHGYPNLAYFWDTVCYIGWTPLIAVIVLIAWTLWRRRAPSGSVLFVALMAATALVLALPIGRQLLPSTSFIVLRSPARLMYLVSFALSLGLGAMIHLILGLSRASRIAVASLTAAVLVAHGADLWSHDRRYVQAWDGYQPLPAKFEQSIRDGAGDERLTMDLNLDLAINRRSDDIGFFDSIMLADTYRGLCDLARLPTGHNTQSIEGGQLDPRGLCACGVHIMVTAHDASGSPPVGQPLNVRVYQVHDAAARVSMFPAEQALFLPQDELRRALRDPAVDVARTLMLPESARTAFGGPPSNRAVTATLPMPLRHLRVNSDRFEITTDSTTAGWVRVLESFDVGWRATLDGVPTEIFPAHTMAMAVPVPAGRHELVLEYFTPGRILGAAISGFAAILLSILIAILWRS